jgi:hypothetical protein
VDFFWCQLGLLKLQQSTASLDEEQLVSTSQPEVVHKAVAHSDRQEIVCVCVCQQQEKRAKERILGDKTGTNTKPYSRCGEKSSMSYWEELQSHSVEGRKAGQFCNLPN